MAEPIHAALPATAKVEELIDKRGVNGFCQDDLFWILAKYNHLDPASRAEVESWLLGAAANLPYRALGSALRDTAADSEGRKSYLDVDDRFVKDLDALCGESAPKRWWAVRVPPRATWDGRAVPGYVYTDADWTKDYSLRDLPGTPVALRFDNGVIARFESDPICPRGPRLIALEENGVGPRFDDVMYATLIYEKKRLLGFIPMGQGELRVRLEVEPEPPTREP